MIPELETGILPCEINRLAQPKPKLNQQKIVLSSDASKKTADKALKGRAPLKKSRRKRKEPSD